MATYTPLIICDHGIAGSFSFHADAQGDHDSYWHSPYFPSNARVATKTEHVNAGWDVTNYPRSIS